MADLRFAQVEGAIALAERALKSGDVANAAGHAHQAARWAMNLADELRYEHGVKAGKAQAAMAAAARRRKRGAK